MNKSLDGRPRIVKVIETNTLIAKNVIFLNPSWMDIKVQLVPGSVGGGTGKVQYSIDDPTIIQSDIDNATSRATWYDWAAGSNSTAKIEDFNGAVTAVRGFVTVGQMVMTATGAMRY